MLNSKLKYLLIAIFISGCSQSVQTPITRPGLGGWAVGQVNQQINQQVNSWQYRQSTAINNRQYFKQNLQDTQDAIQALGYKKPGIAEGFTKELASFQFQLKANPIDWRNHYAVESLNGSLRDIKNRAIQALNTPQPIAGIKK